MESQNELTKAFQFEGRDVRIVMQGDTPWFVAKDVAECLGYAKPRDAVASHCKGSHETRLPTAGGEQTFVVIDKPDVFRLVMHSNMPDAVRFQDWVYEKVLPAIGQHGAYLTPATVEKVKLDQHFLRRLANDMERLELERVAADKARLKAEEEREQAQNEAKLLTFEVDRQEEKIVELTPIAEFGLHLMDAENLYTMTEVAKPLGTAANTLNKFLLAKKIVRILPNGEYQPTHEYQDKGYFKTVGYTYEVWDAVSCTQRTRTRHQLKATAVGRAYIHKRWTKAGNESA